MPSSSWSGVAALAAWGLALAGCSSGGAAPRTCLGADECPASARCVTGACVSNAPPVPTIAAPSAIEEFALHTFDGSASSDPDDGDAVVLYAWEFRALAAPCAPPVTASTGPSAIVRFGCPGSYEVALTVTDEMGLAATGTRAISVAPRAAPPLVEVGPDASVQHLCSGVPLRCTLAQAVALSATAPSLAAEELSWSWTVEPPAERPLGPGRRVTLIPGANVAAPAVAVETDGLAISGDWVFRVEARDAAGVVGAGAVRVTVLNRAPVVSETLPVLAHVFDRAALEFRASGEIGLDVSDPDGDPLVGRSVTGNHAGDGGAHFGVADLGSEIAVEVRVPYAQPSDAAHLIDPTGSAGLQRTVTFAIRDVNDAFVSESWPIVVANLPPASTSSPSYVSVDHAFDAGASAYVAAAALSTWADPEGDPLFPGDAPDDATCSSLVVVDGAARVACSMEFSGMPSVAAFATQRSLTYSVRDPWTSAAPVTTTLHVRNRSPRVTRTSAGPPGLCQPGELCCDFDPELGCAAYGFASDPAEFDVRTFAVDDDGDPLEVVASSIGATVTPSQSVCLPADCAVHVSDPGTLSCGLPVTSAVELRLRDGGPEVVSALEYSGCH